MQYQTTELLYDNRLATENDIRGFVAEGPAAVDFSSGRMRLTSLASPDEGQAANLVLWCPVEFPDHIEISWDFYPIRDPGLCMLFFAATGKAGKDLFDPSLQRRTGMYRQYHSGDIHTLHASYFRRKAPEERVFNVCNLRKSPGFHLVAQGADPIPAVPDAVGPYRIRVVKSGPDVLFAINGLTLFAWMDDAESAGPPLAGGRIGFRQMAPLVAEYANLTVYRIVRQDNG